MTKTKKKQAKKKLYTVAYVERIKDERNDFQFRLAQAKRELARARPHEDRISDLVDQMNKQYITIIEKDLHIQRLSEEFIGPERQKWRNEEINRLHHRIGELEYRLLSTPEQIEADRALLEA